MAALYSEFVRSKKEQGYFDKTSRMSKEKWLKASKASADCYVGNLVFTPEKEATKETQLYALFSLVPGGLGEIKRVVPGVNKKRANKPAGFAFVLFRSTEAANQGEALLKGTLVNGRALQIDKDPGYTNNREYGRGESGNQIQDDLRGEKSVDDARGGAGGGLLRSATDEQGNNLGPLYRGDRRNATGRGVARGTVLSKPENADPLRYGWAENWYYDAHGHGMQGSMMHSGMAWKGRSWKGKGKSFAAPY